MLPDLKNHEDSEHRVDFLVVLFYRVRIIWRNRSSVDVHAHKILFILNRLYRFLCTLRFKPPRI